MDKEKAFEAFMARVAENANRKLIDNAKLPAFSPMHYPCRSCRADMEIDEDDFSGRPKECGPCKELAQAGVLDEFIKRAQQSVA